MLLFTYDYVHHTLDSNCSFFFLIVLRFLWHRTGGTKLSCRFVFLSAGRVGVCMRISINPMVEE